MGAIIDFFQSILSFIVSLFQSIINLLAFLPTFFDFVRSYVFVLPEPFFTLGNLCLICILLFGILKFF